MTLFSLGFERHSDTEFVSYLNWMRQEEIAQNIHRYQTLSVTYIHCILVFYLFIVIIIMAEKLLLACISRFHFLTKLIFFMIKLGIKFIHSLHEYTQHLQYIKSLESYIHEEKNKTLKHYCSCLQIHIFRVPPKIVCIYATTIQRINLIFLVQNEQI